MVQNIYIARHGLRANHDPPPTGIDGDPRLTDDGDIQAQELGEFVGDPSKLDGDRITAIYSSPFYRCLQTATPASRKLSVPIWVETGIGECYAETRPTKPVPWSAEQSKSVFKTIDTSYTPQISVNRNGETRESLDDRVSRAVNAIVAHADANGHDTILLVTHAAVKIAIGEVISGTTVRAGTCSVDKYVPNDAGDKPWKCVFGGETKFLSGGEQMHWSFEMAFEAGSAADEESRKLNNQLSSDLAAAPAVRPAAEQHTKSTLVSLDISALSPSDQPDSMDPSQMVFAKLETDRPVVQIGTKTYEGEWQRVVGTEVFTSNVGEALGSAKHRIKLLPADIEQPQRDRRTLVERLSEVKQEKEARSK